MTLGERSWIEDGAPRRLLTVEDVLGSLRVSKSTFYRAVRTGELPAFKIGGTWRVDPRDLATYIARQKARAASPKSELSVASAQAATGDSE